MFRSYVCRKKKDGKGKGKKKGKSGTDGPETFQKEADRHTVPTNIKFMRFPKNRIRMYEYR